MNRADLNWTSIMAGGEQNMDSTQYFTLDDQAESELKENAVATFSETRVLAEHGHKVAQFCMGEACLRGWGTEQDYIEAAKWYRKSAIQGHAAAQAMLGTMYLSGEGAEQDNAQALLWLKRAVSQGDALAQHGLARMYLMGAGVAVDRRRGLRLLRRAAENGLDEAQYEVGMAYAEGALVPVDVDRASHWFGLGAAQAHEGCQLQLYVMQSMGLKIPENANLGRWTAPDTEEPDSQAPLPSDEIEEPGDDDERTVPDEYAAQLFTILDNYKAAAEAADKQGSLPGQTTGQGST